MSGFYRLEFAHGPHDGLVVEGDILFGPRLCLPIELEGVSNTSRKIPAALYELEAKALHWDEGTPQAVLHYEFRGSLNQGGDAGRLVRWLEDRRHRLARWMMAPVSYPMTTRSE